MNVRRLAGATALLLAVSGTTVLAQGQQRFQRPLLQEQGDSVTPAYEGWYPNADGSINVSYGYYNRNADEIVSIPIGPDNRIMKGTEGQLEPLAGTQPQPEVFQPRRHYGTFAVTIPADYRGELWWTLNIRGEKVSIPSNLTADWKIDARGPTIMGNTPPRVKFSASGAESVGPQGEVLGPLAVRVNEPLSVNVWAADDGVRRVRPDQLNNEGGDDQEVAAANVDFILYRGAVGAVTFEKDRLEFFASEGFEQPKAMVARFSEPGDYRIRVLASDASGIRGDEQCCWTNTFIDVTVTP